MALSNHSRNSSENRLLAKLPKQEYERLTASMEIISLGLRDSVVVANRPIEHVYFPKKGVISLVSHTNGEPTVEVGTIGIEGVVGVPVFLGIDKSSLDGFCQIAGDSWKMKASPFREEIGRSPVLHRLLSKYVQALFTQLAQSVACNRLHSVEQRCARWLLMTHDRMNRSDFLLTQEFLAQMLGVRRATVGEVAQAFSRDGLIHYNRGQIAIQNRKGLERRSCQCYWIVKDEYDRILGKL